MRRASSTRSAGGVAPATSTASGASSDSSGRRLRRKRRLTVLRVIPEHPDDQRRLALVAVEHVEDGEEHSCATSSALGGVVQALQRESVDPRKVRLVEHFEGVSAAGQDLRYEL
jgi:hypothetical protein